MFVCRCIACKCSIQRFFPFIMKVYKVSDLENRWISTNEALPPIGLRLLVVSESHRTVQDAQYCDKNEFRYPGSLSVLKDVVCWRLRPAKPTPGETDKEIVLKIP